MTMSTYIRSLSLTLLIALALVGCRTPDMPPGFQRESSALQNTVTTASPVAVYALMQWYAETNKDQELPPLWGDYVKQQQDKALTALNNQWRNSLISRSASLVVMDLEHFIRIDPTALASRTNWDSMKNQLYNLKVLLKAPRTFPIPVEQATHETFWNAKGTYGKEDFAAWAHRRSITLPEPPGLDRDALVKQLDRIQDAIQLKMNIVTALNKANELTAAHSYFEALDLLDKTKQTYAKTPDVLQALQDTHTIPLLEETLDLIPYSCLRHALDTFKLTLSQHTAKTKQPLDPIKNSLKALDQAAATLETHVTSALKHWRDDQRCAPARQKFQPEITAFVLKLAQLRLFIWKQRLTQEFQNINFRGAMDDFLLVTRQLQIPHHKQLNVYTMEAVSPMSDVTVAVTIQQELRKHYAQLLPAALQTISSAADMALNVNRKTGFALGLGFLARQMARAADVQQIPAIQDQLKKLDLTYQQAEKTIEDTILKRVISISDMSSAVPGMGITYTQDVIHSLQRILKAFSMDKLVTIATTTVPMTRYSYSLYDGVVADFDGRETIERHNIRIVRRFGEIKKSPNPDFQDDATKPPHIFTQEVYEQLINVREIERLAHVRAFINMRGPGFTTLVEVNEFYSKRFIIEDSHPFNDLRVIDVLKTYDLAKHPVQDAIPALAYDRVWTPGEMLDWARKDSLRVFTLKLFFHINQFPFLLANQARHFEQDKNLQESTEFWAYCFALTEQLNPVTTHDSNLFNETSKPAAKCYEQCITDLRQQQNELLDLKKSAHNTLSIRASQLLQSLKKR